MDTMSGMMKILVLLGVTVAFVGCGGGPKYLVRSEFVEFSETQKQEIEAESFEDYRIQEGDILKIAFSYLTDLDQNNVVVLPDGSVTLVGIDRIKVAGLTVMEADALITEAYGREYRDPNLSLIVQETLGRQVYVLGEVNRPGLHLLPHGGLDLIGAVSVAGGFTADASEEGSVLVRVTPEGYEVTEVNLKEFDSVESSALAGVILNSYDVLYVPKSRIADFGYFSRNVLQGLVSLTRIGADIKYLNDGKIGRSF